MARGVIKNNSEVVVMQALQQLAKFKNMPLVVMYRESYTRCFVFAGGNTITTSKRKYPYWDGNGTDIAELIAQVVNVDYNEVKGLRVDGFYAGAFVSSMGFYLIKQLNTIALNKLGFELFDENNIRHVDARGTTL